ncbi:MAG: hypothetical protein ACMXYK_04685 [Candidatus Woesearchaeota archaeon]
MVKLFSTRFLLEAETPMESGLEQIMKSLLESPHSSFEYEQFADLVTGTIEKDGQTVSSIHYRDDRSRVCGLRHVKPSSKGVWTSDYILHKTQDLFEVAVTVDNRLTSGSVSFKERARTPFVIRRMLKNLPGGIDGEFFKVKATPHIVTQTDVSKVLKVFSPEASHTMPFVYISRDRNEFPAVNASYLARSLQGIAHVMVEQNSDFSYTLKQKGVRVPYLGAIGFFWPGNAFDIWVPGHIDNVRSRNTHSVEDMIKEAVVKSQTYVPKPEILTWEGLSLLNNQREVARLKQLIAEKTSEPSIKKQSDSSLKEYEDLVALYEADAENQRAIADDLREKSYFMQSRIQQLEEQIGQQGNFLIKPALKTLYDGEIERHVLAAVESARDSASVGTRKRDVYDAFLDSNNNPSNLEESLGNLHNTLRGYRKMTPAIEHALADLGLEAVKVGKHYEIHPLTDAKYIVTIAATASDHRTGENVVRDLKKVVF